ncbi:MAG: hypothetical protein V1821_01840 [bacterium]
MVIFVYGEDSFRVEQKVKQLEEQFKKKLDTAGYNFDLYNLPGVEIKTVRETVSAPPFLASKRLVVVRGFYEWKEEKAFDSLVQSVPESSIVVFLTRLRRENLPSWSSRKKMPTGLSILFPN